MSPRDLPPVHALIAHPALAALVADRGRAAVAAAARATIDEARAAIRAGTDGESGVDRLAARAVARLLGARPGLRPVINATGILLHTGLGRAPLAAEAIAAASAAASGYCNLEFDLESGDRGKRTTAVAALLRELTGAEAAAVVNNNAGATVIALRAMAAGREVVVSRGQLVEIGGSFRLPEIFEVSGARLREVGTTNRTRLDDYDRAIGPDTAALLRVHPSNYRIVGFTESPGIAEMAALARSRGVACIDDIGSGALGPDSPPGVRGEPTLAEGLAAGADLVLFSGDKLMGGPQCGMLIGRREAVRKVEADPLMRALRVDKLILAALEATLRLALDPERAAHQIPLWSFLTTPIEALRNRAEAMVEVLRSAGVTATVVESTAYLGGGSAPVEPIPTAVVRLDPPYPSGVGGEADLTRALRGGDPAVVPRVQDGAVWLDLRAVAPEHDDALLAAALRAAGRPG